MIYETAEALTYCGNRAMDQGNDALARGLYEEGLAIWRAVNFQPGMARLLLERLERLAHGRRRERTMHLLADDEDMRVHSAPADHPSPSSSQGGPPLRFRVPILMKSSVFFFAECCCLAEQPEERRDRKESR